MSSRAKCRSVVGDTEERCSRPTLPGSRFCWHHVEKRNTLVTAFVGALIGLLLTVAWNSLYPSRELKEARQTNAALKEERTAATERARDLQSQLEVLRAERFEADEAGIIRDSAHQGQIQKLQKMLEPFLAEARQRSPGVDDETALRNLADRIDRLEATTRPRTLEPGSRAVIVDLLKPFAGTRVGFRVGSSEEARRYSDQLLQCFKEARWVITEDVISFDRVFPEGLGLVLREDTDQPPQRALEAALRETGQTVTGELSDSIPPGEFLVVVGSRK